MASIPVRVDRIDHAAHEPGHQPVPWTWPEVRADVQARGDTAQHDATREVADAQGKRPRRWQHAEHAVDGQPDQHDVADCAEAGELPQGNPAQEDDQPGDDDYGPD